MAVKEIEADYDFKAVGKLIRALHNPVTADPSSPVDGEFWYRSDTDQYHGRRNGVTITFATMADVTAGGISSALFDAQSLLIAVSDNTPVALSLSASQVVGRRATGDIGAIPIATLKTDLAITKSDVGLGSVDNVSAANLRDRTTHTGTQASSTISDFTTAVNALVTSGIASWVGAAPAALDTLVEIANRISSESDEMDAILTTVGTKTGKFSANYGNGALLTFTVPHNLGSTDVIAQVRKVSDNKVMDAVIVNTDANNCQVTFNAAPATNSVRVTVIG